MHYSICVYSLGWEGDHFLLVLYIHFDSKQGSNIYAYRFLLQLYYLYEIVQMEMSILATVPDTIQLQSHVNIQ